MLCGAAITNSISTLSYVSADAPSEVANEVENTTAYINIEYLADGDNKEYFDSSRSYNRYEDNTAFDFNRSYNEDNYNDGFNFERFQNESANDMFSSREFDSQSRRRDIFGYQDFNTVAEEEKEEKEFAEIGKKSATLIDEETNRYKITIDVPGKDGETLYHDEIILMVDGSYSMDNEWPAMKEAINEIGRTVLNGSGSTQLTLMAFGMGDNEVLIHVKDAAELEAALGELPGNLLYGRSSTNCEAGFTGVAEYIKNHDDTINDAHVIFISDGNINTDETPRAFDANWQTWTKFGALAVAQETFGGTVSNGENLPEAFTAMFGDRFDGATKEEIIARAFGGEVTDEEFLAFAEQVWNDVYAYSGLTRGEEYPVSDAERAFVKYDKEHGTYIQDLFYYTTYKSAYVTYGDRWTRTPAAADELAAMDEVESLYVVDYDGYTAWMDTGITSEKATFVQSKGIAGLCEALKGTLDELSKTPFNDVYVTDYMSKWVNLDQDTLQITDNITGEVIWTAAEGWFIEEEKRPTNQEVPVSVELVDPSEYEAGGEDVVGNYSGDIYKLTWYVKDGAMLRSDNYTLSYEVTVDTEEFGFRYDTELPANGNTELHYTDENDDPQVDPISVPDVTTPEPPQNPMEDIEWPDPVDPEPEPTPVVPEPTEPTPVEPEPAEPTAEPEPVVEPVADPEPVVEPTPVVEPEQVEDLITIDDEDIPLTDIPDEPVPQTGDSLVWHFASAAATIALAAVSFLNRKKNQNA